MEENYKDKDLSEAARRLWAKSLEAQQRFWTEAFRGVSEVAAGRRQMTNLPQWGAAWWRDTYAGIAHLYLQYAENVVDFTLELANRLRDGAVPAGQQAENAGAAKPLVLRITGRPGETLRSAFALHSREDRPRQARLASGPFRADADGREWDLHLRFEPEQFTVEPGTHLQIGFSLQLPLNLPAGWYHCPVAVAGWEDARFLLLLEVADLPEVERSEGVKSERSEDPDLEDHDDRRSR